MDIFLSRPWLRVLSGLLINLAAVWLTLAFITPNFVDVSSRTGFFILLRDIAYGIMFLLAAVKIEEELE